MVITDSSKKDLSKSYELCLRYNQFCEGGVHVDISTHRQEGVNSVLNMKVLEGAFNHEKAPVGAFSMIVKTVGLFAALGVTQWGQETV